MDFQVPLDPFVFRTGTFTLAPVDFSQVTAGAVGMAALVGFTLSILFFMDQNISAGSHHDIPVFLISIL